ncbi:LacI family DNA-binding transcriptional regulator [Chitinophaga sp. CF418]|uniref:LacI family DNA-binding transcriptional regulator n=1 Tax=Chitinophaga sp. CF418 TaxID=1855287 RepID=UPI000917BEE3|nr:LacI family DNA-binding transcriptional regulator [Chitinophaga sp. CF418]SHN40471.1 transcriptional regulator, LacI family [Chitinophaga sp. CF418]
MSEEKEITIYDIAKHLNISPTTVSRGLKDHPTINIKTRKKIAEAARQLGYRSNTFASSLRSKRTQTLGVIVPRLNSSFMSSVLAGMENAASREGYNLIIAQSLEQADKEMENVMTMFNKRVDGLLVSLAHSSENVRHFDVFFNKKIPVIFFDRVAAHPDSTSIIIDNFTAAYQVTRHLIMQGHKRIMHLGGNMLLNVYSERLRGYKQALQDHKLPFDEKLVITGTLTEECGTDVAKQLLKLKPKDRPEAVFSANDTAAVYCMIALRNAGVNIPENIAFAGFNNDPISRVIEPNLTTVNYPGYNMGQAAVASLASHLNGDTNITNTNTIVLRSELIIRASSGKR